MLEEIQQAAFAIVRESWLPLHMPNDKNETFLLPRSIAIVQQRNRAEKETSGSRHFHKSC